MTPWDQLSRKDQLVATHYDAYKDAYGIRPRWYNYDAMTEDELVEELNRLGDVIEEQERRRFADECAAAEAFEDRIRDLIESGAQDYETALRWIHEAEGTDGDDEYLCYTLGLSYGYFNKEHV